MTAIFTSLTAAGSSPESLEDSQVGVSSLMDVWLLVRNHEQNGERNRTIFILKARGMYHSNQIREFELGDNGIRLMDLYYTDDDALTGSSRLAREALDRATALRLQQEHERRLRELAGKRHNIDAQIAQLRASAESQAKELEYEVEQETRRQAAKVESSEALAKHRGGKKDQKPSP